jgi:hypothetical protein
LFPDSLPKMDDLFLPGGPPSADEMPFPAGPTDLGGLWSRDERPLEGPLVANAIGQEESAPALLAGQEVTLAAASAASPEDNRLRRSQLDALFTTSRRPHGEDRLRPYQVALGLLPFLPAFGFSPVTLREKVLAGRRLWQTWRHSRRNRRG